MRGESNTAKLSLHDIRACAARLEVCKLLCPDSEDFLALDLDFDAEGRAQIGSLHDASSHPNAPRKIGQFERVKHRAAAGVSDHGMFGGAEAVIVFQPVQVGEVLELAIAVGGFLLEGPVAAGLRGGA